MKIKLKDEVGMAGSKSTQTRFVICYTSLHLLFERCKYNVTESILNHCDNQETTSECLPHAALDKHIDINRISAIGAILRHAHVLP